MKFRSLNQQLLLVGMIVLAIVLALAALSITTLLTLRSKANHLIIAGQQAALSNELNTNMVRAASEMATFINTGNNVYKEETSNAVARGEQILVQLTELGKVEGQEPGEQELLNRQSNLLKQLHQDVNAISSLSDAQIAQNKAGVLDLLFDYEDPAAKLQADLTNYFAQENATNQQEVATAIRDVIASVIAILCTLTLMLGLMAILLQRQIIRPLLALSAAARSVSNGNLQHNVPVTNYDQIGDLQWSFNQMVINLREQRATLEQHAAELSYAASEAQSARLLAEEANRAKSAFLSTMSHELRTPLTAILGYTELIKLGTAELNGLAPHLEHDLGQVEGAGKHLLNLINDVLDISKIEAGKATLTVEDFDLRMVVNEVVLAVRPLIDRNSNILRDHTPDVPIRMRSDPTKVRQVLFNLIGNAAKFTEKGAIELNLEIERFAEHDWAVFRVSDTGVGIATEQIPKLFQYFSQIDDSRTRKYGGTGMGLALSRQLCLLLGGDIWVDSELNHGSTFTVRLPLNAEAIAST